MHAGETIHCTPCYKPPLNMHIIMISFARALISAFSGVFVWFIFFSMMTSSNGNIFRVTGHLCGNSPVTGEFPAQRSKKTSKLRVTGLCEGNSPVAGEFPAQRVSNAGNVSIWWRHHGTLHCYPQVTGAVYYTFIASSVKLIPRNSAIDFTLPAVSFFRSS